MADTRGRNTDELEQVELVVDLADGRSGPQPEQSQKKEENEASVAEEERPRSDVRLSREQTLQDLRELQDLSIERAEGRSSTEDD